MLLAISLLPILCKCPVHRSLANLIILIVCGDRQSWNNSSLCLILHFPFSSAGPNILRSIFLSKEYSRNSAACINVHVGLHTSEEVF
jgi:hypothetical protein